MPGPPWLAGTLAAVMIVIAVYCAGRLVVSRLSRRETEADADAAARHHGRGDGGDAPAVAQPAAQHSMGESCSGPRRRGSPGRPPVPAAATRRPAGSAPIPYRTWSNAAPCSTCSCRYRVTQPAGPGTGTAMPGMAASAAGAGSFPVLALLLAIFTLGYAAWTTDRLTSLARATTARTGPARGIPSRPCSRPPPAPTPPARKTPMDSIRRSGHRAGTPARKPDARPPARRQLQNRDEHHHGLHADPDALTRRTRPQPPGIGRGPVWHLPATTVAGRGLVWSDAGGRWLPVWLPCFVSAANLQLT